MNGFALQDDLVYHKSIPCMPSQKDTVWMAYVLMGLFLDHNTALQFNGSSYPYPKTGQGCGGIALFVTGGYGGQTEELNDSWTRPGATAIGGYRGDRVNDYRRHPTTLLSQHPPQDIRLPTRLRHQHHGIA